MHCIGGVNGSEGAIVLVIDGKDENVLRALDGIKAIKGEPQVC